MIINYLYLKIQILQNVLSFFLNNVRRYVENMFPSTLHSEAILLTSARNEGSIVDLAKKVLKFYRQTGLETNTTLLRALMNTECQDLLDNGIFFNP